jgi:uncharacterized spore protein YtfJ
MDYKELVDTEPIAQLVDSIGVKSVFGEPTTEDGVVVIPVAQVEYGFGYGGGYGSNPNADGTEDGGDGEDGEDHEAAEESTPGEGGGGGGGAGGRATPRGFIRITPEGVSYESISDDDRIPLAGILMVAWSIFWITLTVRTLIKSVARVKQAKSQE